MLAQKLWESTGTFQVVGSRTSSKVNNHPADRTTRPFLDHNNRTGLLSRRGVIAPLSLCIWFSHNPTEAETEFQHPAQPHSSHRRLPPRLGRNQPELPPPRARAQAHVALSGENAIGQVLDGKVRVLGHRNIGHADEHPAGKPVAGRIWLAGLCLGREEHSDAETAPNPGTALPRGSYSVLPGNTPTRPSGPPSPPPPNTLCASLTPGPPSVLPSTRPGTTPFRSSVTSPHPGPPHPTVHIK